MIDHLDLKIQLILVGSPFCLCLSGLASDFHIACSRHYHVMTSALQRSPCLSFAVNIWGERNISSRMLVIFIVAGAITFPKFNMRKGNLDAQDYEQLPHYLKRKIYLASWLNTIGFTWLTINYFIL